MTHLNIVNPNHVAYTGSLRKSGDESGDAWFTPPEWVTIFRLVLSGIELDPFSSFEANTIVRAKRFFDIHNSAFHQPWKARTIFMNPPYSRGICAKAIGRLLAEMNCGNITQAIVLVNNMTDTGWFHDLAMAAARRCDLTGRIAFVTYDNKRVSGNTRGQTVFYLGNHKMALNRFDIEFASKGLLYGPVRAI